ncbi:MAG TPA: protoheme IX farnesyltransferase, partial [Cyclobacteriaceae bacterium]|nr:protoheme IX farnesyltransferase [Cyclobacteriaceae bacterium]
MIAQPVDSLTGFSFILAKARAYMQLLKFRLSLLVAFSCAFGFVLASAHTNLYTLFLVFTGGFLLSGASVTINQVMERDYDKLMKRTMNRPLPTGRVSVQEAIIFAVVCFVLSIVILAVGSNLLTVILSVVSMILYCFAYTPLKRVGAIAVFVGAIPGALPPLLGWVAATGRISYEALLIFGIQFIWQFPHFWAIAWVA